MNIDDIRPHHSVGDLILGWTESQVIEALGDDYSREVDEHGDLSVEYEKRGIRCTFWETNEFRLGWISVERPAASLCGTRLFGRSKAEIEDFVSASMDTSVSEIDGVKHEDGHTQEWVDVDSRSLPEVRVHRCI